MRPQFILTAVAAGSLLFNRSGEYKIRFNAPIIILSLLSAWLMLNSQNAIVSKAIAWDYSIRFLKLVILLCLVTNLANSPKKINIVFWMIIAGLLWLSKSVFVQHVFEGRVRVDPLGGGGAGGNAMATTLCMTLPFLFYKVLEGKGWERKIAAITIVVWIFDLVAIASRGGFLTLCIVILLFLLKYKKKLRLSIAMISIVGILSIFGTNYFWDRMANIPDYKDDPSAASRLVLWKGALRMHREFPLCGVGTKNFCLLSKQYTGIESLRGGGLVAHNSYLELLAENGVVGIFLYLSAIGATFILLRRSRNLPESEHKEEIVHLSHALEIGMVAFLFRGLTGTNYFGDLLYWFIGMAGGLYYYVETLRNQTVHENIGETRDREA